MIGQTEQNTVQEDSAKEWHWRDVVDVVVDDWIGYTVIRLAPLAAPLPAIATLLDAGNYAFYIWLTVFGIELTAYALGDQLVKGVRLGVLNIKKGAVGLGIYALAIEGLLLGYKVIPAWATWDGTAATIAAPIRASASVLYPFFTVGGSILFAFHLYLQTVEARQKATEEKQDHRDDLTWEDDREYKLRQRDIELRKLAKASPASIVQVLPQASTTGETIASEAKLLADESFGKRLVRYIKEHPGALQEDIAKALGVSVTTVSREIKALTANGVFDAQKEGRRVVVTVNGNHEQFLAGEL